MTKVTLETLSSLCKRRGFIYQGSEIYGGMAGTWDYGPLGVALKRNITNLWWQTFVEKRDDIYGLDSSILMSPRVWEASSHITTFSDPIIEDLKTNKQYRLDHILEENQIKTNDMSFEKMMKQVSQKKILSPEGNTLGNAKRFNLMFQTQIGPVSKGSLKTYLRPETAQGTFTNFKNIVDSFYPDLPFGIAQIGKNFRNEISPRDYIFRSRELEIMEFEYFVISKDWDKYFDKLKDLTKDWYINKLKLSANNIREREINKDERAHYSQKTVDFEYKYPMGFKEIGGISYRADFDLLNHQRLSSKSLEYTIKGTTTKVIPHVIEPTFGLDRNVLAVLSEAYSEDEINNEKRVFLKLPNHLAPVKVAVFPLIKNKPEIIKKAKEVYAVFKKEIMFVMWDDSGNIGKRYRKQDEIGTPYCLTIDYDSLKDGTITLRQRDTTSQKRMKIEESLKLIKDSIRI
ncbi:MAG TPA: glycine--tRNA ligase [Candidatus Saccharimonadia bacterium]|nr:glycine--tRNA ligase [Candidatus Saccharimonadia bacterium]